MVFGREIARANDFRKIAIEKRGNDEKLIGSRK